MFRSALDDRVLARGRWQITGTLLVLFYRVGAHWCSVGEPLTPRPLASLVMTSSCVQFAIMSAASREGTLPHLTCGDIDEDTPSSCPPLPWPSRTLANGATNETVAINNDATGEGRIVTRARCVPPLANLVFLMSPCGLVKRGPFVWRRRLECGVSDRERESG